MELDVVLRLELVSGERMQNNELMELILSAIDLLELARQTEPGMIKEIFEQILNTSDGKYKEDAEAVQDFLMNTIE